MVGGTELMRKKGVDGIGEKWGIGGAFSVLFGLCSGISAMVSLWKIWVTGLPGVAFGQRREWHK